MKVSANNPSSVFYWKDYENDEGLRVSSLAAQGLWMRLLCVAAKSEPVGYILINGTAIGVTEAARLGGVTEPEAVDLLAELERNGVFSRDRKGRPYSRRLVRDAAKRKKNAKNGKKGGNPALTASARKGTEKSGSDNPPDNRDANPPPSPHTLTLTPSSLRSEDGGGGSARGADEIGPPFRERILAAMGIGSDGVAGPSNFIGGQGDMAEANRWLTLPHITEDVAVNEIAAQMAAKRDGPPSRFSYFTPGIQRLAAQLSAPPLDPSHPPHPSIPRGPGHARPSERRAVDTAINRLADGLASGAVKLDDSSRDPFSARRGR